MFYAVMAAVVGAAANAFGLVAHLPAEQLARGNMAFLMFYFAGVAAGFSYGSHESAHENRLVTCYWHFGKWPYFVTALTGIIHILVFNGATAMLLQLSAIAAVLALLPSLWALTRKTS